MNPRLIICIDGLGFDLISKENTPFLYEFGKKNYLSELETLFAFTGIEYCFFSGKNPDETNIWLEFVRSDNSIFNNFLLKLTPYKIRDYFAVIIQHLNKRTWISSLYNIPKDKLKFFDSSTKEGLWKLSFFQEKNFSFYKWPFFVIKKQGKEKIRIILNYESDDERLRKLLSVKNVDIYYTQLMSVDKVVHKYGKNSENTKKIIQKLDKIIEKYIRKFLKENENSEVIIWSDHGFCDIKNYIDLEKNLPKRKDYLYFIAGTTAHFWFESENAKKEILRTLKQIKDIKILDKKIARRYKIPLSKKYGDLIIYVEKRKYFFPNFYQKSEKERFKAMHGYPHDKELDGFIILNTNDKIIKKNLKIKDIFRSLQLQ